MRLSLWGFVAGLIGFIPPALSDVTNASFEGLGFLPGGSVSSTSAISRNGQFILGNSSSSGGYKGFIWNSSSGMTSVGFQGSLWGISNDGTHVGGYFGDTDTAFRWTSASGIQNIGSLDGQASNRAFAVSADGSTIYGDAESNSGLQAFRWTQSTGMLGLGYPTGYTLTSARATSADGSVAVGYAQKTSGAMAAFRWTAAGGLQILTGTTIANSISADGSTIVGELDSGPNDQAFRWTAAGGTQLLTLPSGYRAAGASSVSADGSVIAGTVFDATTGKGFVWDAVDGMRDIKSVLLSYNLNVSDWTFGDALVAGDGITFTGTGIDPAGDTESWVAVLPEPSLATTVIITSGIAAMRRRRLRLI